MKIYKVERDIANNIKNNNTIAYVSTIESIENLISNNINFNKILDLNIQDINSNNIIEQVVRASIKDNELYYHASILVSTSWNLNDDVFTPSVVWSARNTPVHKPTNIEHDSMKIVGHMTNSWVINEHSELIESNDDFTKLPSKFHILVGSVIYKKFPSHPDYEKNILDLIECIESGEKYVSMECRFQNFDYALQDDKEVKIVARNESTAFLSKYLRAYGGEGYFQDKKLGRVVREISFCGKGYVDKPANPESIIFTKDDIFDFAKAKFNEKIIFSQESGVISNIDQPKSETLMEDNFYKEQYDEANKKNESLAKALDEMKEKMTQSNLTKLEKEIEQLTAKTVDMETVLKTKNAEIAAKDNSVTELTDKVNTLTKAKEDLEKSVKELSDKLIAFEASSKANARISTLVAGGFSKEEADEKVKVFASLNDEQFTIVSDEIIKAKKNSTVNTDNPTDVKSEDLDNTESTNEDVTSAKISDSNIDITDIAKKLANQFNKKKDGDK